MKILIAGLSKTGTTALFYLIANSFGKRPKLLFEPKECPLELKSTRRDVLAKVLIDPQLNAGSFSHFERKITLIRDPRDRIISALLYSQFHAEYLAHEESVRIMHDCLRAKESMPSSMSIRGILEVMGRLSRNPNRAARHHDSVRKSLLWLEEYISNSPGLVYRYEDLVSGHYAELERYLDMPLSGRADVPEAVKRVERTKGSGDWRNWFTPEDVQELRPMLAPWLDKYGYDASDWALSAQPAIEPAHCSGYFMRLVDEYRAKPFGKARIVRAEPGIVAGWVIGADPGQPVRIALLVNGNEVARTVANKTHSGTKARGIHPTGQCGFRFRFKSGETLQIGDHVTVRAVDAGFAIERSRVVGAAADAGRGP